MMHDAAQIDVFQNDATSSWLRIPLQNLKVTLFALQMCPLRVFGARLFIRIHFLHLWMIQICLLSLMCSSYFAVGDCGTVRRAVQLEFGSGN
jgi:hypothetical protein